MLDLGSTSKEALTDLLMNCKPRLRDSSFGFSCEKEVCQAPLLQDWKSGLHLPQHHCAELGETPATLQTSGWTER